MRRPRSLRDVVVDTTSGRVYRGDRIARLTATQFAIFYELWRRPGTVVRYPAIRAAVYGLRPACDYPKDETPKVIIHHVRTRLAPLGLDVITDYGEGVALVQRATSARRKEAA